VVPPHFAAAPLRAAGPRRPITGASRRGLLGYAAAVVPRTQEGLRALPDAAFPASAALWTPGSARYSAPSSLWPDYTLSPVGRWPPDHMPDLPLRRKRLPRRHSDTEKFLRNRCHFSFALQPRLPAGWSLSPSRTRRPTCPRRRPPHWSAALMPVSAARSAPPRSARRRRSSTT
jgi:hypothetical protein